MLIYTLLKIQRADTKTIVHSNTLVNVNSQGPPPPWAYPGILTFEKMCCQSPLYGSKVPCHTCISGLGV